MRENSWGMYVQRWRVSHSHSQIQQVLHDVNCPASQSSYNTAASFHGLIPSLKALSLGLPPWKNKWKENKSPVWNALGNDVMNVMKMHLLPGTTTLVLTNLIKFYILLTVHYESWIKILLTGLWSKRQLEIRAKLLFRNIIADNVRKFHILC